MKHVLFLLLAFITIPAWGTVNEDKKETYPTEIQILGNMGHRTKRILRIERKEYQTY